MWGGGGLYATASISNTKVIQILMAMAYSMILQLNCQFTWSCCDLDYVIINKFKPKLTYTFGKHHKSYLFAIILSNVKGMAFNSEFDSIVLQLYLMLAYLDLDQNNSLN